MWGADLRASALPTPADGAAWSAPDVDGRTVPDRAMGQS